MFGNNRHIFLIGLEVRDFIEAQKNYPVANLYRNGGNLVFFYILG